MAKTKTYPEKKCNDCNRLTPHHIIDDAWCCCKCGEVGESVAIKPKRKRRAKVDKPVVSSPEVQGILADNVQLPLF